MMQLSDTQSLILSAAAQRPGMIAMPLPSSLRGGAAAKVVSVMLAKGLIEEAEATRNDPVWRETGDGHGVTLVATEDGLSAIGIETETETPSEPTTAPDAADSADAKDGDETTEDAPTPTPTASPRKTRDNTKQANLIAMLRRPEGATIAQVVDATGWQPHTVRGAFAGALKKKLGLTVTSEKVDGARVYRIR